MSLFTLTDLQVLLSSTVSTFVLSVQVSEITGTRGWQNKGV